MKWFRISFYSGAISLVFFVDYQLNSADSKAASDSRIEQIEKLREKAVEFFNKGDYAKTLELMKQTLSLGEGAFGAGHTNLAIILDITAGAYRTLGDFSNAMALCERSLAIRESAFGLKSPEVAISLFELASLQLDQGSYATALQLCQRSIEIREKSFGQEHPDVAASISILAKIYTKQGDYFRALKAFQRAFSYWDKHFEINPYLAVTCLADMASINQDLGNFDSSLRLNQAVAALYEKLYGPDDSHLATCWNNIASIYEKQENYSEALTFYQRSLTLKVKVFGLEHPDVAMGLNNLAKILARLGSYAQAMKLYQRALLIFEKTFGDKHPDVAIVLNNIAELYEQQGDASNALPLLERSLQISQTALGKEHPGVASILNNLASIYESQGKVPEALSYYQRSLGMKERAFGTNHPEVISILRNIAVLHLEQGDVGNALEVYAEAFRRRRLYLVVQYSEATDKEAISTIERDRFSEELFHSLCSSQSASKREPILGAEQLALNKALLEEVRVAQAALESDLATATQELRHQRQNALIRLERLPKGRLEPKQQAETRRTIEAELRAIDAKLSERAGLAVLSLRDQSVTISEIARSVPLDSVLVDVVQFWRFDFAAKTNWNEQRYAVYLTFPLAQDSTNIVVERVDLGEAAPINDAVEEFCKLIASGQIAPKRLQPVLQRLGELVYSPLAKYLTNVEHLIVCPDGQLNRLPFEILLPDGADGKYLVEEKTISYVGSGREIVRLAPSQASSKPKARSSQSLVMGDPDFDLDLSTGSSRREEAHSVNSDRETRTSKFGQSLLTSAATSGVRTLSRSARGLKFAPLPAAAEEARSIAKLLGTETTLRLGAEARERELKSVISPRVLHLATHGFFLSDQEFTRTNGLRDSWMEKLGTRWNSSLPKNDWENPLVRCGVALAGANHALQITNAVAEDGLLTGLEASLLNLQGTELVILSACDTGTGEVKIGEGVMSLRRAFRIAGAESVLASHWKVSDKATSQLMTEFMRRWRAGELRAKAWREAQLSLLRSKDFSNPFFWGAFTLTGQWR